MRCDFCNREADNPVLLCRNTRDMEHRAIARDAVCYAALVDAGGGERGMDRIDQIIEANRLLDEVATKAKDRNLP